MYQSTYFIDKCTGTFADNLAAFGLAYVLNAVADERSTIRLSDVGPAYAVACDPPLQKEWVDECEFFVGAPFLITTKNGVKQVKGTNIDPGTLPPAGGDVAVDYEEERQVRADYFTQLKIAQEITKQRGNAAATGNFLVREPHPDWDLFRAINPAAIEGYNAIQAEWWQAKDTFPELLDILLLMTTSFPNNIEAAEDRWRSLCRTMGWAEKQATSLQLFNPSQGKGTSARKTTWSSPNNLKGFWLLEWLKIAGMFKAGLTKLMAGSKDRKTYVLSPVNLEWGMHASVMKTFRRSMQRAEGPLRTDTLAVLRYTRACLEHDEKARVLSAKEKYLGKKPADLVCGMQMAFYKDLGNAVATMNIASLNLPLWIAPSGPEELAMFMETIDEHINLIRNLDENHGDAYQLLNLYRDFLSASDLDPFFAFTAAYSGFMISQRERGKYAPAFTTHALEVLFMNSDDEKKSYSRILKDPGFQRIAYAIRHSTIIPQSYKRSGSRPNVDIRYGLGQQLIRKANYPDDFLAELSEFIIRYNAENFQLREKDRNPFRKDVRCEDLEKITHLVDKYGSRLVCNMLVAYGYATEPRKGDEPLPDEQPPANLDPELADS